jgi:hypothetical protein
MLAGWRSQTPWSPDAQALTKLQQNVLGLMIALSAFCAQVLAAAAAVQTIPAQAAAARIEFTAVTGFLAFLGAGRERDVARAPHRPAPAAGQAGVRQPVDGKQNSAGLRWGIPPKPAPEYRKNDPCAPSTVDGARDATAVQFSSGEENEGISGLTSGNR